MKIHLVATILAILLTVSTFAFTANNLIVPQAASSPLIVEYIDSYRVKANDLKDAITKNFENITIGPVKTSYATVSNPSFSVLYKNGSEVEYLSPTKVSVTNDSYTISFSFTIKVSHILGSATYKCTYATDDIIVNYTKQVELATGQTVITAYTTNFKQSIFEKIPTCTAKPTNKDLTRIKQAVSNSQNSSIYVELNKIFSKLRTRMQQNAEVEHFSQIFQKNPYQYKYYDNFVANINVSTIGVEQFGQKGLVNQIQGTIEGTNHKATSIPPHLDGYNLYFTKQFALNFFEHALHNYEPWKKVKANRQNMRTRNFEFRLIDYEYIVPSVLKKYPQKYLADTQVLCKAISYQNFNFNQKNLSLEVKWSCIASFELSQGKRYDFMNFEPTIYYEVEVEARNEAYLTVYQRAQSIISIEFNIVDNHEVEEPLLVKLAIEEGLFEFQTYPVGDKLRIHPDSSKVKIEANGVWIG